MRVKVDLVKVIQQAAPQVFGSDERSMLYGWLARNADAQQIVEVEIEPIKTKTAHTGRPINE